MEDNNLILDENFAQEEGEPQTFVLASQGKRFANYIIDRIMLVVIFFAFGIVAAAIGGEESLAWMEEGGRILDYFLTAIVGTFYYVMMEGLLQGKTIGKFITRTRAVDQYGGTPDFGTIFIRTVSRFVPFEAFSFLGQLGNGWHDKWSKTMVVEDK
jgi:uncharacterized RDD family membrane protein YckC